MATYKRLTLQQRYLIETLYKQKKTQIHIAQQIGVSQSTVSRELASSPKQQPRQPYDAQQGQQRAATAKKRTPYKLKDHLLTTVLTRLRDRLSPEQICGELQRVAATRRLHHETIYRYIYQYQTQLTKKATDHEELTQYLRIRCRKHYKKRGKPKKRQLMAPATRSKSGEYRPAATYRGNQC